MLISQNMEIREDSDGRDITNLNPSVINGRNKIPESHVVNKFDSFIANQIKYLLF